MVASYQFGERVNAQVILWPLLCGVAWALRAVLAVVAWVLPAFLTGARVAVVTLGWVAVLVGGVALVAFYWHLLACVALIVAFAWVTYPRGK